ncbi:hypothetical protein [Wenxinia marina]|uniref:Uncharacterized protein n=1 Tax=Wenxinia marina DSM 24838 TaxID=1123501 RepID=A0A0D0QFV4_9RHOB|nr:hypothetical protein [Wenxinia marina]KIQ69913.1 hypothetical protein Wenmar_01483 [Wenxinia marina DSM 24838]GGL62170.1 hypothetical protein GCM10011392_15860 [Wenxinia marina]
MRLALALCLAAAPALSEEWSERGTVTAEVDGLAQLWTTYDLSVGASGASPRMTDDTGSVRLSILGYRPGEPDAGEGRILLVGVLPDAAPGAAEEVRLALVGADLVGLRWETLPGAGTLHVTSLERAGDDGYGRARGDFAGRFCLADGDPEAATRDPNDCREVEGHFETEIRFDSM